jgi:hypothetical protein
MKTRNFDKKRKKKRIIKDDSDSEPREAKQNEDCYSPDGMQMK